MTTIWIVLTVLPTSLLIVAIIQMVRCRRRLYDALGRLHFEIPVVELEEFDPVFATTSLGPSPACEAIFIGGSDRVPNGTSDREAWILAVLAKSARTLFEFGTCTGRTAYLWARNSPDDATVVTITLAPDQHESYEIGKGDNRDASRMALAESSQTHFLYTGTNVDWKVRQIFGDSKAFDESPYHRACDLVFVDGSHAYSYVKSDSEKALRMTRPGGIILWHDYRGAWGHTRDVRTYLNELRSMLPLVHLRGTSLVAARVSRIPAVPPGDEDSVPSDPMHQRQ